MNPNPFTHEEAVNLWARLVAGWAHSLDHTGARTLMDGYHNHAEIGGSYEGVTRMLWGLGGWLSQPQRSPIVTWRGENFNLIELTKRGIVNGCDPKSPSFWGIEYNPDAHHDQRTVETGQIAFALWQSKHVIWDTLNDSEKTNIYDFLERFARLPVGMWSNWALFWALNHTCRKALGMPYEQSAIDDVLGTYLDRVYCGDGWYDDAAEKGAGYFDDYNYWVFGSHVLAWSQVDGHNWPERRDELLERIRLLMNHMPHFFAANGAYSEFGRSLSYKFSRLGAPLWAYHQGVWPHKTGMLRRLVGRHLRWYVDRGAIRADGTLRQELTATGSPEIMERYISTGATYWAMQAFGGLWTLPDDDPFWTTDEEPLPAEAGNFTKVYPQPGWVVTANDGEIQRFNAGSVKPYGAKYAKFVYGTRNPFNAGLPDGFPSLDNMLSLETYVYPQHGQRNKSFSYLVGEKWLRFSWEQRLSETTHSIETTVAIFGSYHIRAHRIMAFTQPEMLKDTFHAIDSGSPLGYQAGEIPNIRSGYTWQMAWVGNRMVAIMNLQGYPTPRWIYGDQNNINSVHPYQILPALRTPPLSESGQDLICLVYDGEPIENFETEIAKFSGKWLDDGSFEATNGTETIIVPPLE